MSIFSNQHCGCAGTIPCTGAHDCRCHCTGCERGVIEQLREELTRTLDELHRVREVLSALTGRPS